MKWLNRDLVLGPHLWLATNERDFHKAMRRLKAPREKWAPWLSESSFGCMHTLTTPGGSIACVVCIRPGEQSAIEDACTLIHEAVHVWQAWCNYKGEDRPSCEFEAYAIESISRSLMKAYADLLH